MEEFNQEEGSVVLKCQNEECGIENPAGSRVAGDSTRRIKRSETISYQTVEPGEYRLVLDNSFSYYTSKLVRLF